MERFLCIHGHFYQPPRENPWLEAIEIQDSAFPYHDWNERITAECYAPNSASRNLDGEGRITGIANTYARISFNFGPTLLSWMERSAPDIYRAILAADRQSMAWRSGHGAALAQVYNHVIMPLATLTDKRTQVRWGIDDFRHRFRRVPEGMWLAETAADTETLEVLAAEGLRFTILAPCQAARVRKIGAAWQDVGGSRIDPSRPYLCRLPSGRSIALFFYDGPISHAVAFEKLLDNGERFVSRLLSGYSPHRSHPQLLHIATDGETYGHHHPFGEMALGYALNQIERNGLARLTNYGEFLELHPPTHEVRIVENRSWSCAHGIERWRSDCGCNSGGNPGWSQQWRRPLREALDWLREGLALCFEREASGYLRDPWVARDDYIRVMLDRSEESVASFLNGHSRRPLDEEETAALLRLLEMQRHSLLMYTSCGWFFDDLSGPETVQILQYAGRAVQLAEKQGCHAVRDAFLERLALAVSNLAEWGNGADVYVRCVEPARIDLIRVGAHYAVSSVFEGYGEVTQVFSYRILREELQVLSAGPMRLAVGKVFIRSSVTRSSDRVSFCTLYFGGHALNCGVRSFLGEEAYRAMKREMIGAFDCADFAAIIRLMDIHFGMHTYSLRDLFRDEQRHILNLIIAGTLQEFGDRFLTLFENNRRLMGFLRETGMPVPRCFMTIAETALSLELQEIFTADTIHMERFGEVIAAMGEWRVAVDDVRLEFIIRRRLEGAMRALLEKPEDASLMTVVLQLVETITALPIRVNLWQAQNIYVALLRTRQGQRGVDGGRSGEEDIRGRAIGYLGERLSFNVPALLATRGGEP